MVLKSYRIKTKKSSKNKKKPFGNLVTGGITAVLGLALLSQTAAAVRRV